MYTTVSQRTWWEDTIWEIVVDGSMIFKWIWRIYNVTMCSGSICLRIGMSGGLLWKQKWTFGFHKRRGISWLETRNLLQSVSCLIASNDTGKEDKTLHVDDRNISFSGRELGNSEMRDYKMVNSVKEGISLIKTYGIR